MQVETLKIDPKTIKRDTPPVDDKYKLPKNVKWSDVGRTVVDYCLFFHENQLYMGKGQSAGKDEPTNFVFKCISNFYISILQHMQDTERPSYLIRIINTRGKNVIVDCLTDDMISVSLFKKLLAKYGNFHFTGNGSDFDRLFGYLMDNMGQGRMIQELGWQKDGFFAFSNAAVNGQVNHYDENGCLNIGNEYFYVPAGNKLIKDNEFTFAKSKRIHLVENEINFQSWARQMHIVHRQHAMLITTFGVATVFSDHIFDVVGGFPLVFLYGEASTGKGQAVEAAQTLFGKAQPKITLTGKANTDKGKLRMFAEFSNLIMYLDEYRNSLGEDMLEMLKGIWDRTGYTRGNLNGRFTTDSVPIRSTCILSGNYYPNADDALLTRLLVCEMQKDQFNQGEIEEYNKLRDMMANGYSGVLVELIKHRGEFEKSYLTLFRQAKEDMANALRLRVATQRMVENASAMLAVFYFFEKLLTWPFTRQQFIEELVKILLAQDNKRDSGNDVAHWWDCFIKSVKDMKLQQGKDYDIDGDTLSLFWVPCHTEYLQAHFTLYRQQGHNKTTMRDKLKKSAAWLGTKKGHRIGDRNSSVYQFQLSAINESITGMLVNDTDKPY